MDPYLGLLKSDIRPSKSLFFDFSSFSKLPKAARLMPVFHASKNRKIELLSAQSSVFNSPLFTNFHQLNRISLKANYYLIMSGLMDNIDQPKTIDQFLDPNFYAQVLQSQPETMEYAQAKAPLITTPQSIYQKFNSHIEMLFDLIKKNPTWALIFPPPEEIASGKIFLQNSLSPSFPNINYLESLISKVEKKLEKTKDKDIREGKKILKALQDITEKYKILIDAMNERSRYSKG